jgi:hypothetical protein
MPISRWGHSTFICMCIYNSTSYKYTACFVQFLRHTLYVFLAAADWWILTCTLCTIGRRATRRTRPECRVALWGPVWGPRCASSVGTGRSAATSEQPHASPVKLSSGGTLQRWADVIRVPILYFLYTGNKNSNQHLKLFRLFLLGQVPQTKPISHRAVTLPASGPSSLSTSHETR